MLTERNKKPCIDLFFRNITIVKKMLKNRNLYTKDKLL